MIRSVSDMARLLDEEDYTIRYWADQFRLRPVRSKGGWRDFGPKEVKKLQRIRHLLRVELYTLEGAKRQLGKEEDEQGCCTRGEGVGMQGACVG